MKTSLCANVQLNRSNFDFNLKSSLTPFFHRALQLLRIFTSGQDVILRLAGFYFVLSGLPSSIDGFSGQKLHSDDEEACLNFQQPNICFSCQAFL